jgi:hypothetical protein
VRGRRPSGSRVAVLNDPLQTQDIELQTLHASVNTPIEERSLLSKVDNATRSRLPRPLYVNAVVWVFHLANDSRLPAGQFRHQSL